MSADVRYQQATDEEIMAYVHGGVLRVDPDGSVWRCRKRQVGIRYAKWIDCTPTRCELWSSNDVRVPLCRNSIRLRFPTQRLVWLALVGPIPEGHTVRRRDNDRRNNHPSNLYLERRVRHLDMSLDQLWSACRSPREELIMNAYVDGGTPSEAARLLQCRPCLIKECLNTLRKRASGERSP
jgi:hypothetical protein